MIRFSRSWLHCVPTQAAIAILAAAMFFGNSANSWGQTQAPAQTDAPAAATADVKRSEKPSLATDLERQVIGDLKSHSEIMANLTHLCDVIGPRLTSTPALKKANDWTQARII